MLKRNGQVARHSPRQVNSRVNSEGAFDDQLSLFDFARRGGSKQIYLTQYGLMAERHWREFRPKMTAGFFLNKLFS